MEFTPNLEIVGLLDLNTIKAFLWNNLYLGIIKTIPLDLDVRSHILFQLTQGSQKLCDLPPNDPIFDPW